MAKIYTKTGDAGETGLIGGHRVPKNHIRVEAYGTVDEANAFLGVILSHAGKFPHRPELEKIQGMLFEIGATLADPLARHSHPDDSDVSYLEALIDQLTDRLTPQTAFLLPGGTNLAANLHFARTIVRRAERRAITVSQHHTVPPALIRYLNRLSDYLHTLARFINHEHGIFEKPWQPMVKSNL